MKDKKIVLQILKGLFWKSSDFAFKIKKLEQNHIIKPKMSPNISEIEQPFHFKNFPFFHFFSENLELVRNFFEQEESIVFKRIQKLKNKKENQEKYWIEIFNVLFKKISWQNRFVCKRSRSDDESISNLKWDQTKHLQNYMFKNLKSKLRKTLNFKRLNKGKWAEPYLKKQCHQGTRMLWKTVFRARNKIEKQTSYLSMVNLDNAHEMTHEQKHSIRLSNLQDRLDIKSGCSILDFFDLIETKLKEGFLVKKQINRIMYLCLLLEMLISRVDHCNSTYWLTSKMGMSPTTLQRIKQNSYFLEGLYSNSKNKSCMIMNGLMVPVNPRLQECRNKFHNSKKLEFLVHNIKVSKSFRWRFQQLFTDGLALFEKVHDEKKFHKLSHFFSFYLDLKLQIRQKQLIFALFKTFLDDLFMKDSIDTSLSMGSSQFLILNQIIFGQTHMSSFNSPLDFFRIIFRRFCQNDIIMKHFPASVTVQEIHKIQSFSSHQTLSDLIQAFEKNNPPPESFSHFRQNTHHVFESLFNLLDHLEGIQLLKLSSTLSRTDTVFEDDRFLFGSFQVQLPFYFLHELGLHFILNWNLQLFASRLYRKIY